MDRSRIGSRPSGAPAARLGRKTGGAAVAQWTGSPGMLTRRETDNATDPMTKHWSRVLTRLQSVISGF